MPYLTILKRLYKPFEFAKGLCIIPKQSLFNENCMSYYHSKVTQIVRFITLKIGILILNLNKIKAYFIHHKKYKMTNQNINQMQSKNNKLYKYPNILKISSFITVSMLPGDRNGLPDALIFLNILGGFD